VLLKTLLIFCTLAAVSLLQAADNPFLTFTGSSTVAPLAMEMAKRYEKPHPGIRIDVQTGGSSRGINDVRMGLADVGMVSRH
jgi:phosphate transport system substrate-binding protein